MLRGLLGDPCASDVTTSGRIWKVLSDVLRGVQKDLNGGDAQVPGSIGRVFAELARRVEKDLHVADATEWSAGALGDGASRETMAVSADGPGEGDENCCYEDRHIYYNSGTLKTNVRFRS